MVLYRLIGRESKSFPATHWSHLVMFQSSGSEFHMSLGNYKVF